MASQPGTLVQALNGVLRFEGQSDKSSYVLVNPAAKSLSMVMPSSKQYVEIKFADSTTQALGAMASVMAASTVISDIQVSGTSLGTGGTVSELMKKRGDAQRKLFTGLPIKSVGTHERDASAGVPFVLSELPMRR